MTTTEDRPIQDCTCKRARHQHGTRLAYVVDHCRCAPCTEASRAYEEARRREHLYGRFDRLVDADPVRRHLEALYATGMSRRQVQNLTGINTSTLHRILHGRSERGEGPAKRIIPANANKILALRPTTQGLPDGHKLPSRGVVRRAQALMCLGYSLKWQAEQLGMGAANYTRLINGYGEHVTVATFRKMDALFRRLEHTPNAAATWHEKAAGVRSRNTAARNGWANPAMWDDIDLDDAPAQVDDDVESLAERRRQDAVDLIAGGIAPTLVAERLHTSVRGVQKMLTTAGREDLALEAEHAHQVWKDAA